MRSDISNAQDRIAALREALLAGEPAEIEQCLPSLEAAATALRGLGVDPAARAELEKLRAELRRANRLIEHGDRLWRGWAKMLGSGDGYTAQGDPAPLSASGQLSVRG